MVRLDTQFLTSLTFSPHTHTPASEVTWLTESDKKTQFIMISLAVLYLLAPEKIFFFTFTSSETLSTAAIENI